MENILLKFQEKSMLNALVSSIRIARSEAIKRNSRVVICKSTDGLVCANTGGWEHGWLIFHDVNNNAAIDLGEQVIQKQLFPHRKISVFGNSMVESYISYSGVGVPKMVAGEFQAGTLTLCTPSEGRKSALKIALSKPGNIRNYKATDEQCG
jgi:type IV fimbrial biogenesis protein FimT